ncbi:MULTISPECIES: hypothetical protein [Pseudomonas]|uniref:Adhesin n=1 Tax=Pseudomonas izuensis TaxID=2684212 RepID=A0ABM7RMY8_9PSED|nr:MULTISPECIES: hypothetical protein [Pseudomonas]BCX66562.1 hypothetical protein LAB08_R11800 [Pseudomonas izuensis]
MMAALPSLAADIDFSSRSDFTEMSLELKRVDDPNPQSIGLKVTLSPEAQRRLEQVTSQEMHQRLRLSINGVLVSTATIQSVINGPGLAISVPRAVAGKLVPTLLEPPAS